jgi:hypothetical protein
MLVPRFEFIAWKWAAYHSAEDCSTRAGNILNEENAAEASSRTLSFTAPVSPQLIWGLRMRAGLRCGGS